MPLYVSTWYVYELSSDISGHMCSATLLVCFIAGHGMCSWTGGYSFVQSLPHAR